MFKEDIDLDEETLSKEAVLAEKLRPEARHIAKMEAVAAGELDTLVLGKDAEGWPPGLDRSAFEDVDAEDEEDDEEETVRVELSELGIGPEDLDQGAGYTEEDSEVTEIESAREDMETLKARRLAQYRVRYEDLDKDLDTSPPTMESEAFPGRDEAKKNRIPARLPPRPARRRRPVKTKKGPTGLEDLFEEPEQTVPLEPEPPPVDLEDYPEDKERKTKTLLSYLVLVVIGAALGGGLVALLLSDSGSSKTDGTKPAAVTPIESVETKTEKKPEIEGRKAGETAGEEGADRKAEEAARAEEARRAEEAARAEEARRAEEAAKAALLEKSKPEKKKKTVKKSKKRSKRKKRYTSRRKKRRRKYSSRSKKTTRKKSPRRRRNKKSRKKSPKTKKAAAPDAGNTLFIDGINVKTLPGLGKKLRPGVHIMELRGPDGKVLRRWRVRVKEEGEAR
jgi:hypothetical protein